MTLLGGALKKMELNVKDGDYEVSQYANYKSYADYVPLEVVYNGDFFAVSAFSSTMLAYGLIIYNSDNEKNVFVHAFFKIPFTINNDISAFQFNLNKNKEKKNLLFFTTLNSNDPLRVYEVGNLTLEMAKPFDQFTNQKEIKFSMNEGVFNFTLSDILVEKKNTANIGNIILITLVSFFCVVFICGFVFIFKNKKSKAEIEEERKLAVIEEEKNRNNKNCLIGLLMNRKRYLRGKRLLMMKEKEIC